MKKKEKIPFVPVCKLAECGIGTQSKYYEKCNPSNCMLNDYKCDDINRLKAHDKYNKAGFFKKLILKALSE